MAAVMHSMSYSMHLADKAYAYTHDQLRRKDNRITNKTEAEQSRQAKEQARSALRRCISILEKTPRSMRPHRKRGPEPLVPPTVEELRARAWMPRGMSRRVDLDHGLRPKKRGKATRAKDATLDNAKLVMEAMLKRDTENGLEDQGQAMKYLVDKIAPIPETFQSILEQPYLEEFSGTLNIVPIVGLKNNQIVYVNTTLDETNDNKLQDQWTLFSSLPKGVTPGEGDAVHFFSLGGNFCLSVGRAVWQKKHRSEGDEALKQAADDWPKMYQDEWEKIGDKALPAADLAAITPYAYLTEDNKADFRLFILHQDGTVAVLDKDTLYETNTWSTVLCTNNNPPALQHMAYWHNGLFAVDDQNRSWTIKPDMSAKTYKVENLVPIEAITDLTANERGPVVARADGYLYQRIVEEPKGGSGSTEPEQRWVQWIKHEGVTSLGAASPGVMLDMNLLTRILLDQYRATQTGLVAPLIQIKTFAESHVTVCDELLRQADIYNNADGDKEKERAAIAAARTLVGTAQGWGKKMSDESHNGYNAVTNMEEQLRGIGDQVAQQRVALRDQLQGLHDMISDLEDALSELKAQYWVALAAMFLGIAILIFATFLSLGTVTGAGVLLAGGLLVAGGLAGTVIIGQQIAQVSGAISQAEGRVRQISQAIESLDKVNSGYQDLVDRYGAINTFWGDLWTHAKGIETHDEVLYTQLGMEIFGITVEITAAQDSAMLLGSATQQYIDMIGRQGIPLPSDPDDGDETDDPKARERPPKPHVLSRTPLMWTTKELLSVSKQDVQMLSIKTAEAARRHLEVGEVEQYLAKLNESVVISRQASRRAALEPFETGLWFDMPQLKKAAHLYDDPLITGDLDLPSGLGFDAQDKGLPDWLVRVLTAVRNRVNETMRPTVGALRKVHSTCAIVQDLLQTYKDLSEKGDTAGVSALKDTVLKRAMDECKEARDYAAQANNDFVAVNHALHGFQTELNRQLNMIDEAIQQTYDTADRMLDSGMSWWDVQSYMRGQFVYHILPWQVLVDMLGEKRAKLDGHALTWRETAETISGNLVNVFEQLEGIYTLIDMDPTLFEQLIDDKWDIIAKDCVDVLAILASVGVDTSITRDSKQKTPETRRLGPKKAGDSAKLVQALMAPGELASAVQHAADESTAFHDGVNLIRQQQNLDDLVGYWDEDDAGKQTMMDVISQLTRDYDDSMSLQHPAVSGLWTYAQTAGAYAQAISDATTQRELQALLQALRVSTEIPMRAATESCDKFKTAAGSLKRAVRQIRKNLRQMEEQMEDVDANIDELEGDKKELIHSLVSDIITLLFAVGSILAGIGLGPLGGALSIASMLGLGAKATSAEVKAVMDLMKLEDIYKALTAVKAHRRTLDTLHQQLEEAEQQILTLANHSGDVAIDTADLFSKLGEVEDDAAEWDSVEMSEADLAAIKASWKSVGEKCWYWMQVFNGQGLQSPPPVRRIKAPKQFRSMMKMRRSSVVSQL